MGVSETGIFDKDGQYLAQVAGGAITLGTVVAVGSTDGYVVTAGTGNTAVLGVAIGGYRTSRTATDNVIASGSQVTVLTRGIVNVTAYGSGVNAGVLVQSDTGGAVSALTLSSTADTPKIIGMALTTAASGATVSVKLFRG